jgi:outer membrane protein assembly factor BamD
LVFGPGEQPDKVLYQKATHEVAHARFEVGRLTLQTLINTYPDSEYLSKAKLAIADSYYAEGGVSGFTQAEAEYKDFITFFPTAPEAPEAQFRVGMAHFRLMAKADRDQTEALLAEAEFKEFLLKYPDSPLISRVKGRLRQVQEVLGQGGFYTADFYYQHSAYLAARSRFQEIVDKYPNFSGGDGALYYLGQSLEHLRKGRDAIPFYSHVITDFPLSPLVPQAKERLTAMKAPIPRPTRAMLARAQADASHHVERDWLSRMSGMISAAPDTSTTLFGPVHIGASGNGIEAATTQPPAPTTTTAIVATPEIEKKSDSGKPAEATTTSTSDSGKAQESTPAKTQPDVAKSTAPAKKKSRFHILKKVVDPF